MYGVHSIPSPRSVVIALFLTASMTFAEDSKQRFVPGYVPGRKAITGATVILNAKETLEKTTILIRDGRIEQIGQEIDLPPGTARFDAAGNFVYPAFVDAGCSALIPEKPEIIPQSGLSIDTSRFAWGGTPPDHRKGLTPEFEAVSRIDLSEQKLEFYRQSGIGSIQALPRGRFLSGWGASLLTRGGSVREAIRQPNTSPVVQFFQLEPEHVYPGTVMGSIAHVRQFFLDAEHHRLQRELHQTNPDKIPLPEFDRGYEQIQRILSEKRPVVVIADTRDEIERALDFGAEHQLPIMIWGGREADRSISRLKETNTKVVWTFPSEEKPKFEPPVEKPDEVIPGGKLPLDFPPHRVQERMQEMWNERWDVPGKLLQAGIPTALSSHGLKEPRDFLKQSRQLLDHGIAPAELITLFTADVGKFFGPEEEHPIKVGAPAKLVVLNGSLKEKTSVVRKLLIDEWEQEFDVPPQARIETPEVKPESASSQLPELSGDWTLKIKNGDEDSVAKLTLTQVRGELSGKFESDQGNGRVSKGNVTTDKLEFTVQIGAGDRALDLKFSGTFDPKQTETSTGTLNSKFGTATWTAQRTSSPESKSPVKLSLEIESDPAQDQTTPESAPQETASDATKSTEEFPTELDTDRRPFSVQMPQDLLIRGGRVWTGEQELPQGDILIRDGKIVALEPTIAAVEGVPELDAQGLFVMPGIIDTHSHIMISDDFDNINEFTLSVVPEVRISDVVWTDDVSEYRALAGGVTTARLLHGSANVIGGQHAVVKLRLGKTAREHQIADAPGGVKFALGENVKSTDNRFPNSRMGIEAVIIRALQEARRYRQDWERYEAKIKADPSLAKQLLPPRRDLRLEALRGVLDQTIRIHSHCYRADEILMLLRVADSFGIRVASLQHVLEGYKVAPEISAHGASCSTFSDWWAFKMEAYDAIPHNAALLHQAGVNVCIKSDDWELIRNLNQEASKTVRYGLSVDDALRTITVHPARELGLQDRIGMLKVGMDGDVTLFRGHPFAAGSRCEKTIIDGQIIFSLADQPTAMSNHGVRNPSPPLELPAPPDRKIDWSPASSHRVALVGAVLIPVDAPPIHHGTLIIEGGKIAAIGHEIPVPEGCPVVDVSGYTISPGMIDPLGSVGLTEIGKVRETHDTADTGELQPDLRAGIAVNADSELIPVARTGGITTVNITPREGIISGQSSLMKLSGWTTAELIRRPEILLRMNWPDRKTEPGKKTFKEFLEFWHHAKLYRAQREVPVPPGGREFPIDPRFEAMLPYLRGEHPICIETHSRRMLLEVLEWSEPENIRLILAGATDAWKVADQIKARKIPLILGPVARGPIEKYDPSDAAYANAGRLEEAGIEFCFRSPSASLCRNLPFEAEQAMSYGLSEAAAIRGITLASARILGIDHETGSLTAGKQADLVVSTGSLLEPTTRIEAIFIDGRYFSPESKQTRLADRYRQRISVPK